MANQKPALALADVKVMQRSDGAKEVTVCVIPRHQSAVGDSRIAIALDASRSMEGLYGGSIFDSQKPVERFTQKLGKFLSSLTQEEVVHVFYWALDQGSDTEDVGSFTSETISTAEIAGPTRHRWGVGTRMLPALKKIVEDIGKGVSWSIGVILTDGFIEDEEACMAYSLELSKALTDNGKKRVKLILVCLGEEASQTQLDEFHDTPEERAWERQIDLWDTIAAGDPFNVTRISDLDFDRLLGQESLATETPARVFDDRNHAVMSFPEGLPRKFRFTLEAACKSFRLQVGTQEILQTLPDVPND